MLDSPPSNFDNDNAPNSKPLGFVGMFKNILINPITAFRAIRDHQSRAWLIFGLLSLILTGISAYFVLLLQQEQTQIIMQQALEGAPEGTEIPSGFQTIMLAAGIGGALIVMLLGWLLWSGALYVVTSMLGGRANFGKLLQAVVWASVPLLISTILGTALIAGTSDYSLGDNPLNLSLAAFVDNPMVDFSTVPDFENFQPPDGRQLAIYGLLSQIELFNIWRLVLLIFGVAVVAQVSRRKAAGIVLGLWLAILLVGVIFNIASNSFI